ncbi:hypothetical protein RSOLAG1IB_12650 [Rhizoctonia solani AG-1 IB]|uniref:Uncharacterized protein n=1 Tax=Thanatephorus cucumeris (strain AG1-IB / isolate 7/3/14) TaxID=1108050 RepID=A0A0B7G2Q5_THACB|nr:hypothetical protein RSOLAG1IB_12650 [Rhizoctonia solani AG-1 IB]
MLFLSPRCTKREILIFSILRSHRDNSNSLNPAPRPSSWKLAGAPGKSQIVPVLISGFAPLLGKLRGIGAGMYALGQVSHVIPPHSAVHMSPMLAPIH